MSDIHKCGLCGILTGLLRRAMCVGHHRGSNESYYRELSEQDTLRIDRRSSESTVSGGHDEILTPEYEQRTFQDEVEDIFQSGVTFVEPRRRPIGKFHTVKRKSRKACDNRLKNDILDDYYPMKVQLLLSRISRWEFDTHDLEQATGGRSLSVLCMHLFVGYGLIDSFKLSPEKCYKLFRTIEENYHSSNLYHNAMHAADVMQAVHCFLQQPLLRKHMKDLEVMMVLLAAVTHDLDHPGVNHSFLVATHHPLAIMYKEKNLGANDRSPRLILKRRRGRRYQEMLLELMASRVEYAGLESSPARSKASSSSSTRNISFEENVPDAPVPQPCESILEHHHWRSGYSCVLQSGIFEHMQELLPEIKTMLKSLILATDITRQQEYLESFKGLNARKTLDMRRADHRHIVLQMALKTADISNPGRPWRISKKWSYKVCSEFYAQGDREKKLKLKVSYLCNRDTDTIPKIQTGFFRYVVTPLFTEWHHYLRSGLSMKMLTHLVHNEAEWVREGQRSNPTSLTVTSEAIGISDADLIENDLETSTNISGSSEMLVPGSGSGFGSSVLGSATRVPRRGSFSPIQHQGIKDAIRRYSAPLQLFYGRKKSLVSDRLRNADSASPTPVAAGQCKSMQEFATASRVDSDSAHTSPVKADLIDLSSPRRLMTYSIQVDSDDESSGESSGPEQVAAGVGSVIIEETSTSSGSQPVSSAQNGSGHHFLLATASARTASAPSFEIQLDCHLEEERPGSKAVASSCETFSFEPSKGGELAVVLPQLFGDLYNRRRGSAPAPVAVSDLQRLASSLSLQLGRTKNSASSCQWVSGESAPARGSARRGSLPAEVTPSACIPA